MSDTKPGTPVYPGQRGYAAAVFAAQSRKLPDGTLGGLEACFAAIDDEIAAALRVEREACARLIEDREGESAMYYAAAIRARK